MNFISKFFKFEEKNTNFKTELIAGLTTFLTMAYIIVVNPVILQDAGMSFAGVLFATVIVSAFSSILMGIATNLPYALAPGMGINAFFTYTLVLGMGIEWQTALGAVFISGIIFMLLSVFKIREYIVNAIPKSIRYGVASGIGLFLALIGLTGIGFIIRPGSPSPIITYGNITIPILIFIIGFFLTSFLVIKKIKGALIIGIIATSVIAIITSIIMVKLGKDGFVNYPGSFKELIALPKFDVLLKLDILKALSLGMILPIFSLLFVDMFDSLSTFVGVAEVGGFINEETGEPENVGKALFIDAVATTVSGLSGTSPATTYIESAAGIEEGGKTGFTAVISGLLFLPFMFLWPLLSFIPNIATAPILIIIGLFMIKTLKNVEWQDFEESIPAFLAMILIPLSYSITHGIVWAFLSYTLIKLLVGKFKEIPIALWIIDLFAIVHLAYPLLEKIIK